jgi:predicted  nucleic acid-binding Zn-ribbon protein
MRKRNRTVTELIGNVESALENLDAAKESVERIRGELEGAKKATQRCVAELVHAREALFSEYPELRGEVSAPAPESAPVDEKFEVVEVDDENDPRYTGGVGASVPTSLEFQERG